MEAAALDEASGGRLMLGIGAAQWNLRNLGEADERTRRPYTSTVEAIQIIRALLRGEPVPASEQFTISPQARLDFEPLRRDLPVYAGAVNERMLRAAGAYANSVELGAIMSTGYVRWAIGVIGRGAADAGRVARRAGHRRPADGLGRGRREGRARKRSNPGWPTTCTGSRRWFTSIPAPTPGISPGSVR